MRLYSRWQVILYSIGSAAVVFAVLAAAGFLRLPVRDLEPEGPEVEVAGRPLVGLAEPRDGFRGAGPAQELTGRSVQYSGSFSADEANNIQTYERLNSGVVNITSVTFEYNWFLEPVPREGTGSGSIIDSRGHVLTNYHVIKDSEDISVTLTDGENYKGTIVGVDRENDLAVLKFDPKGKPLTVIPLGSSEDLRVGQKVLAIGNPFALDRTLTTGIVSGLGRPVRSDLGIVIRAMIQTDASINPGNSGGPLLNARGEMIGINTMIYSPSGGSVGIGFAVPVDTAKRVLPDLLRFGKVQRGWLDIVPVQLFPALVRYANLPVSSGILVSEVVSGSDAERAGLRGGQQQVRYGRSTFRVGGDVIVEVDGTPVASFADLLGALEDNRPGDTVPVKVLRGRRQVELSVKLSERPQNLRW